MAGHFECIGIAGQDEMEAVLTAALEGGESTPIEGTSEIVWRDPDGASVAVTVTSDGEVQCLRPTFAAVPRVDVLVGEIAEDPECAYCSRLLVEVVDEASELVYPLAVELERLAPAREASGRHVRLAVSAFAETLEAWPSEDAYYEAHPGRMIEGEASDDPPALASQSLIPSGLFVEEPKKRFWRGGGASPAPTADALVTGVVRDLGSRRNSVTGREFVWLELETYGGSYDAVVAPADASSELGRGAVVQGGFWLIAALPEG